MDHLQAMRIFVRIVETGSFTRAADSLGVTKASVSMSIRELEEDLGARLLFRTTRRVLATEDGKNFFERCRHLLSEMEEARSMFRSSPKDVVGRLRIDMPIGVARNVVIPNLPSFTGQYPGVEFEISCTDRKVDPVSEGFDCVLRVGTLAESGLIAKRIGELTLVNCASPAYIKSFGKPRALEDLSNHRLIHYVPVLGSKPDGFEYFDGREYKVLPMKGTITVNNTSAYLGSCLAGYGIIQVPRAGVLDYLKKKQLVEVLPKHRAEAMPISIVYAHRKHLPKRVQLFMAWLEQQIEVYSMK